MKRSGSAVWNGAIKTGGGTVSTESGVLDATSYSFSKRFGEEAGTNPEELIGAAHAACYSMALSGFLNAADLTADAIHTTATVDIQPVDGGFEIKGVHLVVRAKVPGADTDAFAKAAETAKANCPVSRVLNAEITMDAALEG